MDRTVDGAQRNHFGLWCTMTAILVFIDNGDSCSRPRINHSGWQAWQYNAVCYGVLIMFLYILGVLRTIYLLVNNKTERHYSA